MDLIMHSTKSRPTLKPSLVFEAIGTSWSIEAEAALPQHVVHAIQNRIEAFDKTYSRFREDSLVSAMSRQKGLYTFPDDAQDLFEFYEKLFELTGGKVTPLIGGMLEKAGYDATYSFKARVQEDVPTLKDVMERHNSIVEVKVPVMIDVGAAGKGYLVDEVCLILDAAGISEYVVDASGDMRHKGASVNKVGLEDPSDPTKVIGVIEVINQSLCASASNRRRWGNEQHHIFDPDLKAPTNKIIATWAVADSTMIADGLATALFFTDPQVLRAEFEYEYIRMHSNGAIDYSPAFEGKLF